MTNSLLQRLRLISETYPDRPAICVGEQMYSYRELFSLVGSIQHEILKNATVERIAVEAHQDVHSYASIIAALISGIAYVPFHPKFPLQRNKEIFKKAETQLVLTSKTSNEIVDLTLNKKVILSSQCSHASEPVFKETGDHSIAYVLFTSGSTGLPKGVPIAHRNLNHFFDWYLKEYDFNENDRFLQCYELTFDVSVFSFVMPLLVGACCYVVSDEGMKPFKIADALKRYEITVVSMVPSVIRMLEPYFPELNYPSLRYSFFSGDALMYSLALKWSSCFPNGALHNFYGPTETTIVCTRYIFDKEKSKYDSLNDIVPLGKAFDQMNWLLVDDHQRRSTTGELCFCGPQVISEYLGQEWESMFFNDKGQRYYRTGDLAKVNEEGDLLFLGRKDEQVKIKGYRVELGEINYRLNEITGKECVVVFRSDELIGFVKDKFPNASEIISKLEKVLPDYMIPRKLIGVEEFEYNLNGKIDKLKLVP